MIAIASLAAGFRVDFDVAPPNGGGPLRIGMIRQSANAAPPGSAVSV